MLGVTLPQSYLRLLEQQNGGHLRHRIPDLHHEMVWGIGPQWPSITESHEDWLNDVAVELRPLLVPFDGDGQWFLCFDHLSGGGPDLNPAISMLYTDGGRTELLFETFDEFLDELQPWSMSFDFGDRTLLHVCRARARRV